MSTVLEVNSLSVDYGSVNALESTSLTIAAGQIVTVIGPNGAGKSSLLNGIAGALPANGSVRGTVRMLGENISNIPVEQRIAQGLSLVPEKRELFSSMSVEDNLLLGAYARHQAGERDSQATMQHVYQLFPRLQERRKSAARNLSGGERQMLALGRALMGKPRVLLLDEPSLGLAPLIVKEIFKIIVDLKATGVAILLVEQNARAALHIADHAYVLETGKVELSGAASELAHDARVMETYLGLKKLTS